MTRARARAVIGCLRKALLPPACAGLTDGELLGRFVARRDQDAFAALVRRHGPMVLGVCRRILRHAQDAEDAFQAAFVVLARKAASLRDREAAGNWLYGVALRAALEVRKRRTRREAKEQQVEVMPHPWVVPNEGAGELPALLDRELARLPEKYRLPVVLCELEGRGRREVARQLGLPEGTLSSRLAAARKMLAKRLAACGAAAGAVVAGWLAEGAGAACVPAPLVVSTVKAAGGAVPAGVAALTQGVIKAMLVTKLKGAAWALLIAASLGAGAVALSYRTAAAEPAAPAPDRPTPGETADRPPAPARAPAGEKDELEALRLELDALRADLRALRERVKALEAEGHAGKGRGDPNLPPAGPPGPPRDGATPPGGLPDTGRPPPGSGLPPGPPGGPPGRGAGLPPGAGGPPAGSPPGGFPGGFGPPTGAPPGSGGFPGGPGGAAPDLPTQPGASGAPPAGGADPAAEVEAALKKVREKPDDKQALEALERAVKRLKERADQGPKKPGL